MTRSRYTHWRLPLLEALFISAFILGLFYYWYGVADRYVVFLYGHVARNIPSTQPFDEITSSRYWIAGLVASGAVMVLYSAANWFRRQVAAWRGERFVPSVWWRAWVLAAIPVSVGIPAITMTVNSPTLPLALAVACVVATLLGLAVALWMGQWAGERPLDLMWLLADSVGLMPVLLLLRAMELPGRGVSLSKPLAWLLAVSCFLAGVAWLAAMSVLRIWRRKEMPSAGELLLGGLGLSYVLMPLVHYLVATPAAYRYITTASNFFAFDWRFQLVVLLVATGLAVAVTSVRRRLVRPGKS